jgi:hypothetical protein
MKWISKRTKAINIQSVRIYAGLETLLLLFDYPMK